MLQARHHIDGLDLRVLAIFCRAHFHAQVAAGAVFRGDLQNVFLPAHIAGFNVQRVQTGRGVLHVLRRDHFGADCRVRAGGNAVVTLGAERFLPDRDLFGDVAFLPAGGAHGPGAVRRQGGDRQRIAEAGQHGGSDRFDEIRRGVGDHRRAVRTAGIHRLQRHFRQGLAGQGQRMPVTFHQLLTFAAVAFGDGRLQFRQRAVARQDVSQMEEGHLHHGINARPEATFAGDLRRVDHVKTRFFLIQGSLHFLRQAGPDFIGAVRRVEQENAAGLQPLGHLVFIDKLQLVAANEIGLRNQI